MHNREISGVERTAPRWCRLIAGILIAAHFLAVLTAVTGISIGPFPPSPICSLANDFAEPYLSSLVLDCNYRFYAPNPGSSPLFWVRLQYENGGTRCFEWPSLGDSPPPGVYLRDLSIPAQVSPPYPDETGDLPVSPIAERLLSSYARHVARHPACLDDTQSGSLIKIEFYSAVHSSLSPEQARQGWHRCDLRLCEATFLGSFSTEGHRIGDNDTSSVSICVLTAQIIASDIQPLLKRNGKPIALTELFARERTPLAIQLLLGEHPELLTAHSVNLIAEIERALRGGSN
jgi:hypothetical protein